MKLQQHQNKIVKDKWHWDKGFLTLCRNVAGAVAKGEKDVVKRKEMEEKFFTLLSKRLFSPNTPTWANAGRPWKGSLSACFVYNIEDTMESILDASRWMGMVQKFGGGTGFDLSALRRKGSPIKSTHGKACGPVAVLKYLAATSQMVTQGGIRDGANMAVLSVYHPDAMDFIFIKSTETEFMLDIPRSLAQEKVDSGAMTLEEAEEYVEYCRMNGLFQLFNISIAVDSHFMSAVQEYEKSKDSVWTSEIVRTPPWHEMLPCGYSIADVWDAIVSQAWSSGDPGLLFIDRARDQASCHSPLEIRATNPCVAAGTLVATPDGWAPVENIIPGDKINTVLGTGKVRDIECHDGYPVYKVKFSDGHEQIVTGAHQYHVRGSREKFFKPKRLDECTVGEYVRVFRSYLPNEMAHTRPQPINSDRDFGFMVGCMIGDGCWTETGDRNNVAKLAVNFAEKDWISLVKGVFERNGYPWKSLDRHRKDSNSSNLTDQSKDGVVSFLRKTKLSPSISHEKRIPLEYINSKAEFVEGILDGMYSTDGNINLKSNHPQVRYTTSSEGLAKDLRLLLLSIGCHPRIHKSSRRSLKIEGRTVTNRPKFEIVLSGQSAGTFLNFVSLTHPGKAKRAKKARLYSNFTGNNWAAKILSIEPAGTANVYDLYEPESDTWITEGYVQRGCGEQWLPHNGSCNLGSIDLAKAVMNPWKPGEDRKGWEQRINWEELEETIYYSVRFLDNVVEINSHADPGIDDVNKKERRIGLGIMGWADMLFQLGYQYDCEIAIEIAERVSEFFQTKAHEASVQLAKEKGAFPLYDEVAGKQMLDGRVPMPPEPRRNATVTTIAPTGTISLVAGCSSGIEPHFMLAYQHAGMRDKGGLGLIWASEVLKYGLQPLPGGIDTEDRAEMWGENLNDPSVLPRTERVYREHWGWKPANEIEIEWHIRHQATWQYNIDNSISKTLNLPNSAGKDDVSHAYLSAWEQGCKGSTVYRDGCKPFQVLNAPEDSGAAGDGAGAEVEISLQSEDTEHRTPEGEARDRSPEQPHVLEHQAPKKSHRPRWVSSETAKVETAEGDLYVTITHDDRGMPFEVFAQLGKGGSSTAAAVEALNRTISIGLRYGIHPAEYVRQLRGIKSTQHGFGPNAVFSVPDAIGLVLQEYMDRTFGEDWAEDFGWSPRNGDHTEEVGAAGVSRHLTLPMPDATVVTESCPRCGNQLVFAEGCRGGMCMICNYSKCS